MKGASQEIREEKKTQNNQGVWLVCMISKAVTTTVVSAEGN